MTNLAQRFSRLFRKTPEINTVALERRETEGRAVYAVGDVHGCYDLYHRLERRILEDAARLGLAPCIVLLGDVVDRGPQSADMLDHLVAAPPRGAERFCLRGNHESMMQRFLNKPDGKSSWLDFGGYETLMSYGMRPQGDDGFNLPERQLRLMLETFVPKAHRDYLDSLPYGLVFEEFVLVHAAFDHDAPIDAQPKDVLLWGATEDKDDGAFIVVHGHTIVDNVVFTARRMAIDTGAYATGRLSAVRLIPGPAPQLIEVTDSI